MSGLNWKRYKTQKMMRCTDKQEEERVVALSNNPWLEDKVYERKSAIQTSTSKEKFADALKWIERVKKRKKVSGV